MAAVDVEPLVEVPRSPDGTVVLDALWDALPGADLLESADGAGWSYLVPPGGSRLVDDGVRTWLHDAAGAPRADLGTDPFEALTRWCADHGLTPEAGTPSDGPPFTGGLLGAFAYDLGRRIERVPVRAVDDRRAPHLSLRVAEVVVAIAPSRREALLLTHDLGSGRREVARRADATRSAAAAAAAVDRATATAGRSAQAAEVAPRAVTTSLPRERYLAAVRAVLDHIAAGDSFQVNLTQRLTTTWDGDLPALYRALRAASPAPHAACLHDVGVASVSPETFLRVTGRDVVTRPIKGTRPRDPDPALDGAMADDLATSAKDRAENVMIVDLARNDLGRVCEPGSVHVPELCAVEAHPTVWHLVSTVGGRLRPGVGYGDLLRASFPCGSITGAPKVRAMAIVESLEPVRRGWYCGAVGYLGAGAASLSVAIRTATRHPDGTVDHGAGGGIVADSDPTGEHDESWAKAAAFLRATGAVRDDTDREVTTGVRR
ncbi:anthranilate synthase component I family protein [Nitriliruptoraceae bacterium ZYF776]|nr:anthranilate synthase component I family protein [Profundirhabdus halotolerans]